MIAQSLQPFNPNEAADVCVIGCGPAGLALSSELAKQGLSVCLIGNGTLVTLLHSVSAAGISARVRNATIAEPKLQNQP